MQDAPGDLETRWQAWRVARNRRGMRSLLFIVLGLYPLFGVLDFLVAPAHALPWLLGTRVVVTAGTLAMFPVLRSRTFERHGDAIGAAYMLVCATGITLMTWALEGLASPYYAGLGLAIVATGVLFVWPARVIAATHSAIVATFVLVNVAGGKATPGFAAVSNLMFLTATALIAGIGQVLAFRSNREQHAQRVQLERTSANLERAHHDLQQLDQFKSRFFANMTHELRTPLAMVLTPLELALQGEMGEFTESQRAAFATMFRNALKLLKLINDLLDLSRLEESRLRLRAREEDLVAALRTLVQEIEVLAVRKNIAVRFDPELPHAPVQCDLDRLERVFVNLLSNAVKFTPPGGQVRVSVSERPDAYDVVVEDDGPGFPPEEAGQLFERFYQVDMAGTRQHGGAGIGLALAREIVLLHGGAIDAWSDGRNGARFTVSLRKGIAHLPAGSLADPERDEGREGDFGAESGVHLAARRDIRLLDVDEATERRIVERDVDEGSRPYTAVVVEDNPQVVRLVHMALRRHFRIFTAPDGLKGLEMVQREKPNLVVTDLMMPGIDGFELTRRLREDGRTRHIPILMLTARVDLEDRVHGLETGVDAYLTKPFSPKELVTSARRLVHAEEETADLVLEQRVESLEMFAAGLAHELNNPLNYVKNALARVRLDAEDALRLAAPGEARPVPPESVEKIERAATRMRELLRIADSGLKRIAGTVELMGQYGRAGFRRGTVPHDVWEAARTVIDLVGPATGRRVRVELDVSGDGTLDCVPDELNQVITNLVQNAIEAAPEDTGLVRVVGRGDADALVLTVSDNGPGLTAEVQARLFTPFFTTKGAGRGMGLGLTITRRVVQTLGGTLHVTSTPGQGAAFVARLPRRRRPVAVTG